MSSARYSETVGGLFTHLADNNNIAYFTVDGNANGINIPVTNIAKLIRILKSGVYEIVGDADVFYRAYPKGNASPTAATTTATAQNGKFANGVIYMKKLEEGQAISVITSTTANFRLVPTELK
jgi:hypothetical protein